jgi:hypothetical protein
MLTKEDLEKVLNGFRHIHPGEREAHERIKAEVDANQDGTVWLPQGPIPPVKVNYDVKQDR